METMASVYDTLYNWARRTTSSFGDMKFLPSQRGIELDTDDDGMIYKLRHWPDLSGAPRTAPVLRALSVMSHRPVNRRWIIATSKLNAAEVDRLLQRLIDEGAVVVVDKTKFVPTQPGGAGEVRRA
jgi:hypothetical protein